MVVVARSFEVTTTRLFGTQVGRGEQSSTGLGLHQGLHIGGRWPSEAGMVVVVAPLPREDCEALIAGRVAIGPHVQHFHPTIQVVHCHLAYV